EEPPVKPREARQVAQHLQDSSGEQVARKRRHRRRHHSWMTCPSESVKWTACRRPCTLQSSREARLAATGTATFRDRGLGHLPLDGPGAIALVPSSAPPPVPTGASAAPAPPRGAPAAARSARRSAQSPPAPSASARGTPPG